MTTFCLKCGKEFKDRPNRILSGRTKYCSKVCMDQMQKNNPKTSGNNSPHWKGENVTYAMKHIWTKETFGSPMICEFCLKEFSSKRKINWANISGLYKRDRSDWVRLCIPCHRKFDNHGEKIKQKWIEGVYNGR